MINALAGLLFGLIADDWVVRLLLPLGWGFVACLYHALFSDLERNLYIEEYRRRGRKSYVSRWIYYGRHYRRAFVISLMFSFIGGLLAPTPPHYAGPR